MVVGCSGSLFFCSTTTTCSMYTDRQTKGKSSGRNREWRTVILDKRKTLFSTSYSCSCSCSGTGSSSSCNDNDSGSSLSFPSLYLLTFVCVFVSRYESVSIFPCKVRYFYFFSLFFPISIFISLSLSFSPVNMILSIVIVMFN